MKTCNINTFIVSCLIVENSELRARRITEQKETT